MIAIDVTPCCGQATGVGRYVADLMRGFDPTQTCAVYQGHHGAPPASLLARTVQHGRYDFLGGRIGARLRLGKLLTQFNCSLYHSTSTIAVPGPSWTGAIVSTIHDCHPIEIAHSVSARSRRLFLSLLHAQLKRSHLIITPSEHTARSVRTHGWSGPLHIIPHGLWPDSTTEKPRPSHAPSTPYIITLGAIAPTKGLSELARALRHIPEIPWFHIGPVRYDPGNRIQNDMHLAKCTILGYLPDAERDGWLAHAWLLCQPSRAEGFGYPPLEAMAHGVPVLARHAGAVPEVVGDAALYLTDDVTQSCIDSVRMLQQNPNHHQRLATQARLRAAQFTHTRMIEAHINAYRAASQCASP